MECGRLQTAYSARLLIVWSDTYHGGQKKEEEKPWIFFFFPIVGVSPIKEMDKMNRVLICYKSVHEGNMLYSGDLHSLLP